MKILNFINSSVQPLSNEELKKTNGGIAPEIGMLIVGFVVLAISGTIGGVTLGSVAAFIANAFGKK